MIRHIVMWNLKEEFTDEEKKKAAVQIKEVLEPLRTKVPGTTALSVVINKQETSNRDIMLIATFESVEALKGYIEHPAHVEAGKYVRSVTCDRACIDFEL